MLEKYCRNKRNCADCIQIPTYPKDEIEYEKQIFHTFHSALHLGHRAA